MRFIEGGFERRRGGFSDRRPVESGFPLDVGGYEALNLPTELRGAVITRMENSVLIIVLVGICRAGRIRHHVVGILWISCS